MDGGEKNNRGLLSSVLIVGGKAGIGLEFVRQFFTSSTPPQHIFATCRQESEAKELRKLASSKSGKSKIHIHQLELRDYGAYPALAKQITDVVGVRGLDLMINVAGVYIVQDLCDVKAETMRECFDIDALSRLMLVKEFLPLLKDASESGPGALIVNITADMASMAGMRENIGLYGSQYPYRVSKAALNAITMILSADLKPLGINVVGIHPGWVRTEMGGSDGRFSAEESVGKMMATIENVREEDRGRTLNFDGAVIPF